MCRSHFLRLLADSGPQAATSTVVHAGRMLLHFAGDDAVQRSQFTTQFLGAVVDAARRHARCWRCTEAILAAVPAMLKATAHRSPRLAQVHVSFPGGARTQAGSVTQAGVTSMGCDREATADCAGAEQGRGGQGAAGVGAAPAGHGGCARAQRRGCSRG